MHENQKILKLQKKISRCLFLEGVLQTQNLKQDLESIEKANRFLQK